MHPLRTYFRLTVCGTCLFLGTLGSQGTLPQLSADDPLAFDKKTRELKATGRATLVHDRFHMVADEIRFAQDKGTVIGEGDVKLVGSNFRALADDVEYRTLDQKISANNFRMGTFPDYIQGTHFDADNKPNNKEMRTEWAEIYRGEPDFFTPNMYARELKGWPGGIVEARHLFFRFGPIPIFYTPYAVIDTDESAFSLKSEIGNQKNLGHFIRNDVYVRMKSRFKPGFLLDQYKKRGTLYGPAARYSGNGYTGEFFSGYIRDRGHFNVDEEEKLRLETNRIPRSRYFFDYHHLHEVDDRITFNGHFVKWSDFEVVRDFRPKRFANNQQPDTFGELSYAGSDYVISAFTRVRTNKFQLLEQRVPEIRFDYLPSPLLDTPIYHSSNCSYTHVVERALARTSQSNYTYDKWDGYYGWHLPIALNDWSTLTPVAGARINHYRFAQTPSGDLTRVATQVGFDAEMRAYGQWEYENKFWDIDGLRHAVTPFAQYRNIQYLHRGKDIFVGRDFSDNGFLMDPIDLSNRRKLYPQADHHVVRVGLDNRLQTRHKEYGSRDLASISIFQDAGFSRVGKQAHTLDLYTRMTLSPVYWLAFSGYNRLDPRTGKIQETYTSTTFNDGDVRSLSLSTTNAQGGIRQMGTGFSYMLTRRHIFSMSLDYNATLKRITRQTYQLKVKLGNSWWMTYEMVFRKSSAREGAFQYDVQFDLVRF